jgi:hypothetical protein
MTYKSPAFVNFTRRSLPPGFDWWVCAGIFSVWSPGCHAQRARYGTLSAYSTVNVFIHFTPSIDSAPSSRYLQSLPIRRALPAADHTWWAGGWYHDNQSISIPNTITQKIPLFGQIYILSQSEVDDFIWVSLPVICHKPRIQCR